MVTFSETLRRTVELHPALEKILLGCGVVASAWWVAIDVVGSLRYAGYSYIDQTISELSAEDAPTRVFMSVLSGIPYVVLMTAFGVGIWTAAGGKRAGRLTGALLAGEAVWGFVGGLLFPMAIRGTEGTLRNDIHAFYGIGMPILFLLAMGFGSTLFGKRFRNYSYGTILTLLVFGALTSLQAGRIADNQSTPWAGLEERINAYASMLWLAVLAISLLRAQRTIAPRQPENPAATPRRMQRLLH